MGFNKVYRSLFSVELLHHYFLDEAKWSYGFTPVIPAPGNEATVEAEKEALKAIEQNLSKYRLSNVMDLQPSKKTIQTLKNTRSRFIKSDRGFQVVTNSEGNKPFIPFSDDLTFDFIVRITDPLFENYTNITINRSEPLFLTNVTPAQPRERKEMEERKAVPVSFCLLSKFKTDLTNGSPALTLPMLSKEVDLDEIESREFLGAFAIIRIHLNGEAGEISLTDAENGGTGAEKFNVNLPKEVLMFENRSTIWKYHRSADAVQVYETPEELPLTKHGYVSVSDGTNEYPNPSARMIYNGENDRYVDPNGDDVIEIVAQKYSRTFI